MEEKFLENITILLVEDNKNDLEILNKTLSKYFKRIYTACDGEEAYKIFKENKDIDIIISDIEMPKMSGLEFLKLVRLSNLYIPFIITSGKIEVSFLLEAINLNASSFLSKPISIKSLLEKVDILCEKKLYETRIKLKQNEIDKYLASVDKVAVIYKMNSLGEILYMNSAMREISGYSKNELKGLKFQDIIHPDIPSKYLDNAWDVVKNGKLWKGNTKFISKDKETFYLTNTVFRLDSKEDEFITIAFLTTQENLEKRNFHKKLISTLKDFNIREYNYKNKIDILEKDSNSFSQVRNENEEQIQNLKAKLRKLDSQVSEYENEKIQDNIKYSSMLQNKKEELERYVNLIQIEKAKAEKFEEENYHLKSELKKNKEQVEDLKDETFKLYKRIKDLREVFKEDSLKK
ncbi:hypothetical protein CRV02_04855 [Arcobacter sp. CECT 8989]|uniref:response regulator n=1 Tax=Arcobacter sp. CECT 8989 TaxID=2044509 RepID=UPI00100A2CC1|nr:response regulator [Arcobacter sp. CECT 8989]RXK02180.1 hypothetical protein CRV02_04855 [Arcobacter sp. CECT 8989]